MSALLSMQVLLFAGEAFAASSLIMMLAWLAAARRTASQRHLVWASAFGALIALPALAAIVPAQIRLSLAAPVMPVTQGFDTASVASLPEPSGFSIDAIVFALIALWLIGVAAIAARGLIAAFALRRLRKHSVAHRFGHLPIAGPRCELRLASEDCGPMTWGILRPIILLPEDADCWPRARLEAVLLHELAHIRRYDALTQFLALIVCAFYWPNPLVWLGASRLRREAETAADDAVLEAGVKPSAYAGELLQIASEFRVQRLSLPLAMAAPSALEARVKSVLEPNQSRSGVTSMDVFKIACLGMMATTAIAFARPSLAQDAPQGPAVTAAPLPPAQNTVAPPAAPATPAQAVSDNDDGIVVDNDTHGHRRVRHWSQMSPQEKAHVRAQIREAMANVKPQIERAMRDAHFAENAQRAVEAARPQIEAAIEQAQRVNRQEIDRAMENARVELADVPNEAQIKSQVNQALARAHVQLEAMRVKMHDHGVSYSDGDDDMSVDDVPPPPPAPPVPAEQPALPAPAMPPAPPPPVPH
jgi:beta-lactamase regulating signal transducer with metallopeptidase domain